MRNIFHPTKFIYSYVADHIKKYQHMAKGYLVDVGCGKKPFKDLFKNTQGYIGIDITAESKADLVCDVLDIKLKFPVADSVLCTQVIEHVERPEKLIEEIFRISKPGAICILTAPFLARIHGAPYDYFRFTKFGLEYIFKKKGFKIIVLEEIGGLWLSLVYLMSFYLKEKIKWFSFLFTPIISFLYLLVQKFDDDKNHPCLYLLVAKKEE